ncbi:AAA family ATPase [Aureispira anguillae]|uniref:AAA family ATPase n=1 Tax=Aureispira anguillae TaxID=2864201 RepID=A0A916DRV2_9BACT|nr:AAA family ATPase [Aureispira anguillae]BDS10647.1 AAA family ATPase [Aureispira anguillae]
MEKFVYPLLYYQLSENRVLGLLVGTHHQIIDRDLKNVKSSLTTHLRRLYKKYDDYPYTPFESFRLKTFEVKIRPVYRDNNRSYPSSKLLKVPVDAVLGPTDQGNFCCFLPLLGESFYYYDSKLLTSLVQNFATNILNKKTPDEIYRMITGLRPRLDEITLRINLYRDYNFNNGWSFNNKYKELEAMAERYPQTKSLRKNIAAFPDVAWELEREVGETVDKLVSTRSNVLLVGEHGTGKSSILRQAIRKITAKASKLDLTFWQLMAQRITARAKYLGEWQQNVEELLYELECANGILWVVDMVQLLQTGGEGPEDSVAAFLTSFLQNGKLQMVGEVTPAQLESMRRMLPGFVENFQIITLEELPEHKIQTILDKFADYCSQNMKIEIDKKALSISYRLLLRYYPYESFPGKGVKFLSQCINQAQQGGYHQITKKHIIDNFIQQTGMPELFLRDDLLLDDQELTDYFKNRIIGQDAAIASLSNVVKIFKAGLNSPLKPIATMIFAGPTGVGKTASTKALAEYFFGKGQKKSPLVRIDMSEFQHPAQLARFIGIGGEVGKLVQEIRERPFSVLLLDEIEKADPSVFDALLTVLDEGLLVDAYGRVTNFRNTIIIMTSNLGASNRASVGFGNGDDTNYESAIAKFFRPEFVNRIDHIVTFNTLEEEHIKAITRLELKALSKREGLSKRHVELSVSTVLEEHLAAIGFDKRYGARPLQRALEDEIIAPLAKWLLSHPNTSHCTLRLDLVDGQLAIN